MNGENRNNEETLKKEGSKLVYRGEIFSVRKETFQYADGSRATREVVIHPGAVCVIPHDGRVLYMVEQPREAVEEQVDQLFIARWDCSHALKPIAVRQVNDEWIEPRPFFRFENLKRCIDIQSVGAKPIDRFRGKRDRFASTKMCNRCPDCRSKLLRCPCGEDIRRHFADR